jgi:hypothetical protein
MSIWNSVDTVPIFGPPQLFRTGGPQVQIPRRLLVAQRFSRCAPRLSLFPIGNPLLTSPKYIRCRWTPRPPGIMTDLWSRVRESNPRPDDYESEMTRLSHNQFNGSNPSDRCKNHEKVRTRHNPKAQNWHTIRCMPLSIFFTLALTCREV